MDAKEVLGIDSIDQFTNVLFGIVNTNIPQGDLQNIIAMMYKYLNVTFFPLLIQLIK